MYNKKKLGHELPSLVLIITALLAFNVPMAAEIEAEFHAGYMVSDNIFLVPDGGTEDNVWVGGMSLELAEETNRIFAEVRAAFDYLHYAQSFDPEWFSAFAALVDVTLIDERLTWMFEENYGQRLFDPLASPNPGNRENVSFFSTGPNLRFPIGSRNFMGLEGRYSTVRYEVSLNDNDRTSALLQFGRRSSANSTFSLNFKTESIMFDDDLLYVDFDIAEAYIEYDVFSARNVVVVQLGYSELDVGFDTADGYLVRVDWTRISHESRQFFFGGGSQYSTQGDIFRFSQSNGRDIGGAVDVNDDDRPFRSNFIYARYNMDTERTRLVIELDWNQDDYDYATPISSPQDRDSLRGRIRVERELSSTFYVHFSLSFLNRDLKYIDRQDDDISATLTLGYRFSPAISMFVSYRHYDRESTDSINSFTESRAIFGIEYIPPWGR